MRGQEGGRTEGRRARWLEGWEEGRKDTWKEIHAWGGLEGPRRARVGGRTGTDRRLAEGWEDEGEEGRTDTRPPGGRTDGRTDGASPQLPFEKDCGADNICVDDLQISFNFSG